MRLSIVHTGLIIGVMLTTAACGAAQSVAGVRDVSAEDPRIAGLWRAAARFDRAQHGFTPLTISGEVKWESVPRHGYDAMLHTYSPNPGGERTIAFRRTANGYRWIGEQQTFNGPSEYDSVDGRVREQITIAYEIEPVSGAPLRQLSIHYWGKDPRLGDDPAAALTLAQVRPILAEWGVR